MKNFTSTRVDGEPVRDEEDLELEADDERVPFLAALPLGDRDLLFLACSRRFLASPHCFCLLFGILSRARRSCLSMSAYNVRDDDAGGDPLLLSIKCSRVGIICTR